MVVYGTDGFVPDRMEIELGQQVTFSNRSEGFVWPTSNIHPTHEVYPDFDAEEPVAPGREWAFAFERPGFWRYHNHLSPSHSGLVVVKGKPSVTGSQPPVVDPGELEFRQPEGVSPMDAVDLFRDDALLARFAEEYGPANTVRLLSEIGDRTGVDCHPRAHQLGRIAHELFGSAAFSLSGHECHSGGYHGATEAFFHAWGTATLDTDIQAICGESLNSFFRHQCVHGCRPSAIMGHVRGVENPRV